MQNSNFISKETLFNDLPPELKKKLIELRNLSQNKFTFPKTHPLKKIDHISIPSCNKLYDQFCEIVKLTNCLSGKNSIEDNYNQSVKDFSQFANHYKNNINNLNIVDEFEKTIALFDEKYQELSKKYKSRTLK
ncbi:hypothetical protein EBI_25987 [Enterocytozoon bieneusi H348]|nr:hypothetical protein EBI_25987 [Enterocytozoon bieneusi H348]|eukprot:XP_002649982.1 hypothetical protein EBI_25987 [Enterocytozoon bieneusi H348]